MTGEKSSVLMVDDREENLLALEATLEGMGLDLVKARSGTEALRRVLEADFAVILLDVNMPTMDGFETAALIRQREHAKAGSEILKQLQFPWPVAEIVRQHHERWDGSGYPDGLKGTAIRREASILAVADVVEAMASHRPFRAAIGVEAALAEIEANKGTLYDLEVAEACLAVFRKGKFAPEP